MKTIKFKHFESAKQKANSIQIYLGNLNMNEFMDDIEVEMNIVEGDIHFTILNQEYYESEELKEI